MKTRICVAALAASLTLPALAGAAESTRLPSQTVTLTSAKAVARDCTDRLLTGAGVTHHEYVADVEGAATFRIAGARSAGDWDLAVFDAAGRKLEASANGAATEVVSAWTFAGDKLTLQACRRSGQRAVASADHRARGGSAAAPGDLEPRPRRHRRQPRCTARTRAARLRRRPPAHCDLGRRPRHRREGTQPAREDRPRCDHAHRQPAARFVRSRRADLRQAATPATCPPAAPSTAPTRRSRPSSRTSRRQNPTWSGRSRCRRRPTRAARSRASRSPTTSAPKTAARASCSSASTTPASGRPPRPHGVRQLPAQGRRGPARHAAVARTRASSSCR